MYPNYSGKRTVTGQNSGELYTKKLRRGNSYFFYEFSIRICEINLFLIISFLGGISLVCLIAVIKKGVNDSVSLLHKFIKGFILLTLFLVITQIITNLGSSTEAYEAMLVLLKGSLSFAYVWVAIFFGLLIPLLMSFYPKSEESSLLIKIKLLLIIIGVFALRYAIIIGGQILPLS